MRAGLAKDGQPAGFASRAVAICVDFVIVTVGVGIGVAITGIALNLLQLRTSSHKNVLVAIWGFVLLGAWVLYNATLWTLAGKTVGQAIFGLRVSTLRGKPLRFARALLRVLAYAISALPFFLGFAWVLIDDRRMAWHDHLVRTWVVYDCGRALPQLEADVPGPAVVPPA